MDALRWTSAAAAFLALLAGVVLPAAASAAATASPPQPGPLSPAFVEALHDPLVTLGLGRVPSPVEVHVGAAAEAKASRLAEPTSFSLLAEGRVTPVKDQGPYGTCWAFANVAALESKLMPADPAPDFSEDNLVGRSGFGKSLDWRYTYGGYDFMAVAYFARWAGPVSEADDPYVSKRLPRVNHARMHVQGVTMIPGRSGPLDNDLVKRLVRENGALSVGMYWADSAYSEFTDAAGVAHATYYLPSAEGENHGVDIVGWDDAYPASNFRGRGGAPELPGAFLVRNSWGDRWGEHGGSGTGKDGYFWVSYYDGSFARRQGLGRYGGCVSYSSVEGPGNYVRAYQYDKLGVTDHWGYGSASVWGATRFTAGATQTIAAAGFYTLSSATRYEVWAGRSLKRLGLRASGTIELPGYTTVPLGMPLPVVKGRAFVIAVKLVSPGASYPLAVERPAHPTWMSGATARAGRSFMSRDGSSWTDTCSVRPNTDVCLKAFAR